MLQPLCETGLSYIPRDASLSAKKHKDHFICSIITAKSSQPCTTLTLASTLELLTATLSFALSMPKPWPASTSVRHNVLPGQTPGGQYNTCQGGNTITHKHATLTLASTLQHSFITLSFALCIPNPWHTSLLVRYNVLPGQTPHGQHIHSIQGASQEGRRQHADWWPTRQMTTEQHGIEAT